LEDRIKKLKSYDDGPQSYRILQEFHSGDGSLNIDYELSLFYPNKELSFNAPTLLIPRGPCQVELRSSRGKVFNINQDNMIVLPPSAEFSVICKSSIFDCLVLQPKLDLNEKVLEAYPSIIRPHYDKLMQNTTVFSRTNWLDEIIHRYFFERVVSGSQGNDATNFLETEIFKEVYFVATKEGEVSAGYTQNAHLSSVTQRAIEFMENHLFDKITIKDLAKQSKASESTLLRAFKHDLSIPPFKYLRLRRLDEAMKLLRHENIHVGDVANLLGYESFSAFSEAFKERFGVVPSSCHKLSHDEAAALS
jgi:AraC-like DNA-binding protein